MRVVVAKLALPLPSTKYLFLCFQKNSPTTGWDFEALDYISLYNKRPPLPPPPTHTHTHIFKVCSANRNQIQKNSSDRDAVKVSGPTQWRRRPRQRALDEVEVFSRPFLLTANSPAVWHFNDCPRPTGEINYNLSPTDP